MRRKNNQSDPERLVWYAKCLYWTDEWGVFRQEDKPRCPRCGSSGFTIKWAEWKDQAQRYEDAADHHRGYWQFLRHNKQTCHNGKGIIEVFEQWKKERLLPMDTPESPQTDK